MVDEATCCEALCSCVTPFFLDINPPEAAEYSRESSHYHCICFSVQYLMFWEVWRHAMSTCLFQLQYIWRFKTSGVPTVLSKFVLLFRFLTLFVYTVPTVSWGTLATIMLRCALTLFSSLNEIYCLYNLLLIGRYDIFTIYVYSIMIFSET